MAHRVWHELYAKMLAEGKFNLSLLTPDILEAQFKAGVSGVRPSSLSYKLTKGLPIGDDEKIMAHGTLRDSKVPWWKELAQIWVDSDARGNGLMWELICELIARAKPGVQVFCITSDGSLMKLLERLHFRPMTQRSAGPGMVPVEWAQHVGIGGVKERLPESVMTESFPDEKPPKDGERWLFIRF